MANYNRNADSFINGLSDFWLLYFKEIDQLEELYKGTEILVGQGYLDLMALLLNNSTQDATIFNKEYFKLLRIKESDLRFRQATTPITGRYEYRLPDNLVAVRHLNNKIFNPTLSLDNDVEFLLNSDNRTINFAVDPMNAYLQRTFGSGESEFTVRSLLTNPTGNSLRVWLNDTGGPVTVTVSAYDITISYDGPANSGTTTAAAIVQAINTHFLAQQLLFAALTGAIAGPGTPPGTVSFVSLEKVSVNPLNNAATRNVKVAFAGEFFVPTQYDWVAAGVEKGDILRLLGSPTVGAAEDLEINLVRTDALFVEAGGSSITETGAKQNYAILRRTAENLSDKEPLGITGQPVQSAADGVITGATRQLVSASAMFSKVHEGDLIQVLGTLNVGYFTVLEVVNPSTVVLSAAGLVDESLVAWTHLSTIDPLNVNTDGTVSDNGDGTVTFTAASANFGTDMAGTVLRMYRDSVVSSFEIVSRVSSTSLIVTARSVALETGLPWGWARYRPAVVTVAYSPPIAWIDKDEPVVVTGRRMLDSRAVQEGVDYTFSRDTGILTPLTVWQPSVNNTISYRYLLAVVENVTPLQSGANGVITPGTPATFSSATASFTDEHVGYAITISNTGLVGAGNNGVHFISKVLTATSVELTTDRVVPSTVDPNNGALIWQLNARGEYTTNVTADVYESAYWCPDVLVDRFHLYNTFGYLINRFDRSSEEYRSLIRGIFQLFMLGPTLERFEAAINVVAGLSVIRDTGEILISYTTDATSTGTDGVLVASTNKFSAASAAFTAADAYKYLYISTGFNANKLFKILSVISSTEVLLDSTPTSDTGATWELTETAQQYVRTSRATYTFDRRIPLRSSVTNPANVGIKIFKAFEVLTDAFKVTDYVENPQWWDLIQIPSELMPNQPAQRRQSSPVLFENVVNPADEVCVGDPGFYIGADSDGVVPAVSTVRTGVGAGYLNADPLYPYSNNVYFDAAAGAFTSSDVGNLLSISSGNYLIEQRVSATRIKVQSFLPVTSGSVASWSVLTGTLPKRHKAAFVILDKLLKYHLFQVYFDLSLTDQVKDTILVDLQELVFVAKPSYTYIALTPAALFQERIQVDEDFDERTVIYPGGAEGMVIAGNENPLVVIGASWRVGTWFRYLSNTSTFAAPAASVSSALGAPPVGYDYYLNKVFITPTDFTSTGNPIQVSNLETFSGAGAAGGALVASGDTARLTVPTAAFNDQDALQYVTISGSGLGNDGVYRITAVISSTEVDLYAPGLSTESGLTWAITASGSNTGAVVVNAQGLVYFVDYSGRSNFTGANVGDFIRRPYTGLRSNQALRIHTVDSSSVVQCAEEHRVHPIATDPDIEVSVNAGTLSVTVPNALIFSESMCQENREKNDYATSLRDRYFIEFSTGPDAGSRFYIQKYIDANTVELQTAPSNTASALCHVGVIRAPAAVNELSSWELVREQITLDNDTIQLPNVAIQDINPLVSYTAYGVQEPTDPTVTVFDAASGDTYYSVGMPDPRQHRGKSRTGRDTDLREEPLQITRTP